MYLRYYRKEGCLKRCQKMKSPSLAVIPELVAKGPDKEGNHIGTRRTKKSFSFVVFVPLWFRAFMLATDFRTGICRDKWIPLLHCAPFRSATCRKAVNGTICSGRAVHHIRSRRAASTTVSMALGSTLASLSVSGISSLVRLTITPATQPALSPIVAHMVSKVADSIS